ncbi:MAG: hypothetical protein ACFFEN_14215 [Candidatus Thorarchaeota archaeon]
MPSENYSKKKTTQQTISITSKLKERIENYVHESQEKNPDDPRFKSVSALYNYVMETTLDCFDKGKNLDDLDNFVDSEFKTFFDRLSFSAVIPYYEEAIKTNRYSDLTFEKVTLFFLTIRKFYLSKMDPTNISSIKILVERIKNYLVSNNLTKEFKIDLFTGKTKTDLTATFEFVGLAQNLGYETCKYTAAFFGLLGIKVTDCVYSFKDIYYRYDLKATDLFYRKDLAKPERIKLMNDNLTYFTNYSRVINDEDYYLWMKMAEDKNIIICFNNEETKKEWTNLIQEELSKYPEKEEKILHILKYFEKMHWVDIENTKDLIFHVRLFKPKYQSEREYMFEILSQFSNVSEIGGKYYLPKVND